MVIKVEFKLKEKEDMDGDLPFEVLEYINTGIGKFEERNMNSILSFDFYSIVEINDCDNHKTTYGTIICWNSGSDLENVHMYRVRFKDGEN